MQKRRTISRRRALTLGAVAGAAVVLPVGARAAISRRPQPAPPPAIPQFAVALPIPTVLQPARSDAGTDYYELTQQEAQAEILPGLKTTIWGFNGQFPGPTIETRTGRQAVVRVTNHLPALDVGKAAYVCGHTMAVQPRNLLALSPGPRAAATVVHLHGGVTPPDSDGFPTDLVPPGSFKDYTYPNLHRAATLFYHDHAMDSTAYHNYMGLSGMYITHDEAEERLPLPKGEYDIPLILQDRSFNADGSFAYKAGDQFFADEDAALVNGAAWPRLDVAARKYRFRILNSSNSRPYVLRLSSGRPLVQIATDGGLLPAPVQSASIDLSPAERIEVVVDFADYPIGSQVVLQNRNKQGPMSRLLRFDVVRGARDDSAVPAQLSVIEPLRPEQAVRERTFTFEPLMSFAHFPYMWKINGQEFDPNRVDATPKLGDIEIWRFRSGKLAHIHGMPHPVHVHLVNFQVLDRNGKPPAAFETGWKDTVNIPEGEEARVIMRFEGFKGRYMLHCHNLQHEDCAMMTTFEVV